MMVAIDVWLLDCPSGAVPGELLALTDRRCAPPALLTYTHH
jgi:hypothetical protein